VKDAVTKAGILKPASPHWLRHRFGTWTAYGGANAFMIQWAMGHAKLETSSRYVHMAKGLEDSATDYLPALVDARENDDDWQ
jgi:integrase/recombinase XerD